MKKTIKRRTEITIETRETTIWRARVAPGTDDAIPQVAADSLPEVLLFGEETLSEPGIQSNNIRGLVTVDESDPSVEV
jgi:hypothetical protein